MKSIEVWAKKQWVTKQIAYNLIRREVETDQIKVSNRLKRCNECVYNKDGICRVCTCIIEVKVTSRTNLNKDLKRIEITHCPKSLWVGEEEVTKLYL